MMMVVVVVAATATVMVMWRRRSKKHVILTVDLEKLYTNHPMASHLFRELFLVLCMIPYSHLQKLEAKTAW
jgi:hypothetical protein